MTESVKADVRAVVKFSSKPVTYSELKAVIIYILTLKEKGLWDKIEILTTGGFQIKGANPSTDCDHRWKEVDGKFICTKCTEPS